MTAKTSWYETGYEGADKEAEKRSLGYPPDRFWLKPGSSAEIIFVSDDPFCIREHTWKDGDDFWHACTCTSKIFDNGCGACGGDGVSRADYVGHYTIIDVTGYTSKKGVENKNRLMLFPAKTKVLNKFKMKKESRGSLLGQLWTITRADKDSPNTGDDLDHVRELKAGSGVFDVANYKGKSYRDMIEKANGTGTEAEKTRKYVAHHFQIPAEGPIPLKVLPFNYPELMAPIEYGVLKSMVANAVAFNQKPEGSGTTGSGSSSEDVPF